MLGIVYLQAYVAMLSEEEGELKQGLTASERISCYSTDLQ
jgi:hypothetical protein